MPWMSH